MICPGLSILLATASPAQRAEMIAYTALPGESLRDIGERGLNPSCAYGEVGRLNHLTEGSKLASGQKVLIPRALLRTEPQAAVLDTFSGAVIIRGGLGGTRASVGAELREGAIVETGPNSSARLKLVDGSVIALPSNSRIRLDRLRRVALTGVFDRAISVLGGGSESTVTPSADRMGRFIVTTPVAVSAVRGTVFRVTYDAGKREGSSGVLKGAVGVSGRGKEVLPKAGEGVTADPQGVGDPKALLPAPKLKNTLGVQVGDHAAFDIQRQPGVVVHHVRITSDAELNHTVDEREQREDRVSLDSLQSGAYFAQVSDLAAGGLEGLATVYSFTRQANDLTDLTLREERGVAQRRYTFSWRLLHTEAATYRFRLASAARPETPIIDQPNLQAASASAADLPAGSYVWQVTAELSKDAKGGTITSERQPLTINLATW